MRENESWTFCSKKSLMQIVICFLGVHNSHMNFLDPISHPKPMKGSVTSDYIIH
jgi:hypothetical protein